MVLCKSGPYEQYIYRISSWCSKNTGKILGTVPTNEKIGKWGWSPDKMSRGGMGTVP